MKVEPWSMRLVSTNSFPKRDRSFVRSRRSAGLCELVRSGRLGEIKVVLT